MVRAGPLRQRVNIEQSTQTADAAGQLTDAWESVRECSARVLDVSAAETFAGSQIEATTSTLVIIRYPRTGPFPDGKLRVVYEDGDNSRTLNLEKVLRREERQTEMGLHCTEDS